MVGGAAFDHEEFAERLRVSLGFGRYVYIGRDGRAMVRAMRLSLLDAYDAQDPGQPENAANVVIDARGDDRTFIADSLRQCASLGARYAVVICDLNGDEETALRMRDALEKQVISDGYRKSPAYYGFNTYYALNHASGTHIAPFERVPQRAMRRWNLEVLQEERLLHTDMLREVGRRSDAHCIRYHYAAEFIRPGDRVLDVACGLGYGSHILFCSSKAQSVHGVDLSEFGIGYAKAHYGSDERIFFTQGDAEALAAIPDASIDFIAGFETIEHVPHPHEYLRELRRVLAPGGRVMVCAPNDWTDETGRDPNPYHLHVYTWERLKAEIQQHFLLEKAFVQVAGGAMKCHFSPRSWSEVQVSRPAFEEAEWIVFLGMKDPRHTGSAKYVETGLTLPKSRRFNVSAFERDYSNPWLVRSMVAIGQRLTHEGELDSLRRAVVETAPVDSVDYGAALCGIIYGLLQNDALEDLAVWRDPVEAYLSIRSPAPHQRRWQVSIAYAYGLASFVRADIVAAKRFFALASSINPIPYSPLLGTKTLDALFMQAVISLGEGDLDGASSLLQKTILLIRKWTSGGLANAWYGAWTNIVGLNDAPHASGLAEMGMIFDKGARAAYMLAMLQEASVRPGAVGCEAQGFFERQINGLLKEARSAKTRELRLLQEVKTRSDDLSRVEGHARKVSTELLDRQERVNALAAEVIAQDENAKALARELSGLRRTFDDLGNTSGAEIARRDTRIAELVQELTGLQGAFSALCERAGEDIRQRDMRIDELAKELAGLDRTFSEVCERSGADIAQRDTRIAELAGEVIRIDGVAQELARKLREMDMHSKATEAQMREEIAARDHVISEMRTQTGSRHA